MNTYYVPGTLSDPREIKNIFPALKNPCNNDGREK